MGAFEALANSFPTNISDQPNLSVVHDFFSQNLQISLTTSGTIQSLIDDAPAFASFFFRILYVYMYGSAVKSKEVFILSTDKPHGRRVR